jgi:peptidyl-prolyl cis-trans isomerase C
VSAERRGAALRWLLLLAAAPAAADSATLASVGPRRIDADSFRERARHVAAPVWAELGATWPEQRQRFLEQVLVPEALLSLEAERSSRALPPARDLALARALGAALEVPAPSAADIDADYAQQRRELETPRALALSRILVRTEAEARAAITQLQPLTLPAFSRLARELSIDRATHMRAGNLGLVAADGHTQMPELRVSPALYAAAEGVRDGELVPQPVREGDAFAVVWRRSSQPAAVPDPVQARRTIQARLESARRMNALRELIASLRREHLREHHPELTAAVTPRFDTGASAVTRVRAAEPDAPPAPPAPQLEPQLGDRGLR